MRVVVFAVGLSGMLLGACTLSVGDEETARPAIETPDMNAFWAAHVAHRQANDLDAALAILAEDVVLYEPFRPPVSGLRTIAAKMEEAMETTEIHEVSLESREVYHHGGWLVDFGVFSETFSLAGSEDRHLVEGSYAAVLELDGGGWKVKRLMAMPSTPPPDPGPEGPDAP